MRRSALPVTTWVEHLPTLGQLSCSQSLSYSNSVKQVKMHEFIVQLQELGLLDDGNQFFSLDQLDDGYLDESRLNGPRESTIDGQCSSLVILILIL